jgi:hypothetical protein
MKMFPRSARLALVAMALALAGCGGGGDNAPSAERTHALPNVSLVGSPNATLVGLVDPHQATASASVGGVSSLPRSAPTAAARPPRTLPS